MMDITSVRKAYRFYAPAYDYIFGRIVHEGRRLAISRFRQAPGDRILETGIGTGLSLPFYKPHVKVTGIDVSPEMLRKARRRFQKPKFPHVGELLEMDAEDMDFPDDSFEGSVAMYVASVVPNPKTMMNEIFRVTRPGAPVLVVNHFSSEKPILRRVENRFAPLSRKLGFRPDFSLEQFISVIGMEPENVTRVNIGGYWKLLEFRSPPKPEGKGNGTGETGASVPVHSQNNGNGVPEPK